MAPIFTDKFGVPLHDIIFNASLERLEGIKPLKIIGNTSDVIGTEMLLWDAQIPYTYQTSSQLNSLAIASENAGDNASTGQGAHTVEITGLDETYTQITETVSLSGQTPINLAENFLRINKIDVQTAGDSGNNLGNIWIGTAAFEEGEPVQKIGLIESLTGCSAMGLYTVPASHHALIYDPTISCIKDASVKMTLWKRERGKTFHRCATQHLETPLNVNQNIPYVAHEKADVQIRVIDGAGLSDATAGYCNVLLIENEIYGQWGCL